MTKRKRSANHKLQQITVTVPCPICNTLFVLGSRIKKAAAFFVEQEHKWRKTAPEKSGAVFNRFFNKRGGEFAFNKSSVS